MPEAETDARRGAARAAWRRRAGWFAGEFAVVVAGILTAVALQTWWDGRAETARERAYLRQLAADLRETERLMLAVDALTAPRDRAGAQLFRAFQHPAPPPRDTLLLWLRGANFYDSPRPVTATAEALVATGDLNLLRDDSLRAAVTAYLGEARGLDADQDTWIGLWTQASATVERAVDYAEVYAAVFAPGVIDSLARAGPLFPIPPGERRNPFPLDARAFFGDRAVYHALWRMNLAKMNLQALRAEMRDGARRLRTRVEAALEPDA